MATRDTAGGMWAWCYASATKSMGRYQAGGALALEHRGETPGKAPILPQNGGRVGIDRDSPIYRWASDTRRQAPLLHLVRARG